MSKSEVGNALTAYLEGITTYSPKFETQFLPWDTPQQREQTPPGFRPCNELQNALSTTPTGLILFLTFYPKIAFFWMQPWAVKRNPVGIHFVRVFCGDPFFASCVFIESADNKEFFASIRVHSRFLNWPSAVKKIRKISPFCSVGASRCVSI
jgi:hypothetical protein